MTTCSESASRYWLHASDTTHSHVGSAPPCDRAEVRWSRRPAAHATQTTGSPENRGHACVDRRDRVGPSAAQALHRGGAKLNHLSPCSTRTARTARAVIYISIKRYVCQQIRGGLSDSGLLASTLAGADSAQAILSHILASFPPAPRSYRTALVGDQARYCANSRYRGRSSCARPTRDRIPPNAATTISRHAGHRRRLRDGPRQESAVARVVGLSVHRPSPANPFGRCCGGQIEGRRA